MRNHVHAVHWKEVEVADIAMAMQNAPVTAALAENRYVDYSFSGGLQSSTSRSCSIHRGHTRLQASRSAAVDSIKARCRPTHATITFTLPMYVIQLYATQFSDNYCDHSNSQTIMPSLHSAPWKLTPVSGQWCAAAAPCLIYVSPGCRVSVQEF